MSLKCRADEQVRSHFEKEIEVVVVALHFIFHVYLFKKKRTVKGL